MIILFLQTLTTNIACFSNHRLLTIIHMKVGDDVGACLSSPSHLGRTSDSYSLGFICTTAEALALLF